MNARFSPFGKLRESLNMLYLVSKGAVRISKSEKGIRLSTTNMMCDVEMMDDEKYELPDMLVDLGKLVKTTSAIGNDVIVFSDEFPNYLTVASGFDGVAETFSVNYQIPLLDTAASGSPYLSEIYETEVFKLDATHYSVFLEPMMMMPLVQQLQSYGDLTFNTMDLAITFSYGRMIFMPIVKGASRLVEHVYYCPRTRIKPGLYDPYQSVPSWVAPYTIPARLLAPLSGSGDADGILFEEHTGFALLKTGSYVCRLERDMDIPEPTMLSLQGNPEPVLEATIEDFQESLEYISSVTKPNDTLTITTYDAETDKILLSLDTEELKSDIITRGRLKVDKIEARVSDLTVALIAIDHSDNYESLNLVKCGDAILYDSFGCKDPKKNGGDEYLGLSMRIS